MSPEAYLTYSIKNKCYKKKEWIIGAFTVTRESKGDPYVGKLVREPYGLFYYNEKLEKEKIEGVKPNEALYRAKDEIVVTREMVSFLKTELGGEDKAVTSTIGRLLANLIAVYEPFYGKVPYFNEKFTPGKVEEFIIPYLESTPKEGQRRENNKIYVDEFQRFCTAVSFIETLSPIFAHGVTSVGLFPAPGRKEFKKKLLKDYEGKLDNPIEAAKFEEELKQYDKEYLKNDPSYGMFMSGKVSDARVGLFMSQGAQIDEFGGGQKVTTVVNSLEDGVPLNEKDYVALINTSRYGSFSRGSETVNGGVLAQALMRAADMWKISSSDCGSVLGDVRVYDKSDIKQLVGRYVLENKKPVLIENIEQAERYIGRLIHVRSPMYCRKEGEQTCTVCAGVGLSRFSEGVSLALMDVSGGILTDSLKKMHSNKVELVNLELEKVIT